MIEKYKSPCPPPEGLKRELLTILAEEASEITQRASKALRFGVDEIQPGQPYTNGQRIGHEIGDLIHVAAYLQTLGIFEQRDINVGAAKKQEQLAAFLQSDVPNMQFRDDPPVATCGVCDNAWLLDKYGSNCPQCGAKNGKKE